MRLDCLILSSYLSSSAFFIWLSRVTPSTNSTVSFILCEEWTSLTSAHTNSYVLQHYLLSQAQHSQCFLSLTSFRLRECVHVFVTVLLHQTIHVFLRSMQYTHTHIKIDIRTNTHFCWLVFGTLVMAPTTSSTGAYLTSSPFTSMMVSPGYSPPMKAEEPGSTLWTKVWRTLPRSLIRP